MLKFVVRRLLWTIPIILLVIFMTFLMMKAIKGSPFRRSERAVPPAVMANLNRKFGLDKPWYQQYFTYVEDVAKFDLGPSLVLRNQDVNGIVKEHFPVSAELGGLPMLLRVIGGRPRRDPPPPPRDPPGRLPAHALREPRLRHTDVPRLDALHLLLRRAARLVPDERLGHAGIQGPTCRRAEPRAAVLLRAHRAWPDARDAAAGLCAHGEGEGPAAPPSRRRARAPKLAHPGRHGGRSAPRLPRHGLVHHREH